MSGLLLEEEFDKMVAFHCAGHEAEWALNEIAVEANGLFPVLDEKAALASFEAVRDDRSKDEVEKRTIIREYLAKEGVKVLEAKAASIPADVWDRVQRILYIQALDQLWMNHLDEIEYLRQGIGLRGYGQRDPLVEYKREAFNLFTGLLDAVRKTYLLTVLKIEPAVAAPIVAPLERNIVLSGASDTPAQFGAAEGNKGEAVKREPIHAEYTVGRNDPCPCGAVNPATGEIYKFKKCGMIHATHHKT
jgi:preprotein translocase subunit SecA